MSKYTYVVLNINIKLASTGESRVWTRYLEEHHTPHTLLKNIVM